MKNQAHSFNNPNDRDKLAMMVMSETPPLPNANPSNARTLVHDDIVSLRYKLPFLPLIGVWHSSTSIVLDGNTVYDVPVPDGAYMALFTSANPEGMTDPIWVGIDCDVSTPAAAGDIAHGLMFPVSQYRAVGPVLLNQTRLLLATGANGSVLNVLFWSALS